jgi:K+-transporting ATPase ATPase C chain
MLKQLRGAVWLLALTVLVCGILYPLSLWLIGRVPGLHDKAEGSLVTDAKGNVVGSRLIAQNFEGDEFFQPRPSHAGGKGYEANASGASNWAGSNYLLRDRVARQLGPIVRYGKGATRHGKKPGAEVGPDIEVWFQQDRYESKPGIVAQWAALHPGLAEDWVKKTGEPVQEAWQAKTAAEGFARQWRQDFPAQYAAWQKANPDLAGPTAADLAKGFFPAFAAEHPGRWPFLGDTAKRKQLFPVKQAGEASDKQNEIQAVFFDLWRQAHPDIDLEPVPADMVTASGSGLDPHITLANALYQAPRVARARAKGLAKDAAHAEALEQKIRRHLVTMLNRHSEAPMFGLAGVPLINVLEANLALPGWVDEAVR